MGIAFFFLIRFIAPLLFSGKLEKIGITGNFHTDNLPTSILGLIGDGLTKVDESGNVEPVLANSWESPDKGKTWIFHLKDGLFWQDGKKVTSKSIVYEFSDVDIERPNDSTLIFKLQNPFSPFPYVVSRPTFKKGLLGTGKWRVSKISLSGSFVQSIVLTEKEGNKKIIKFYPTEERTKIAFKSGEVNDIQDLFNLQPFETWKVADVKKEISKGRVITIFFNTQDKFLSEKNLRQALSYAIDKSKFDSERALSSISPNSWSYNPQVKPYDYDLAKAKKLIEDLPKESKQDLKIKLVTSPVLLSVAESIAKDWETLGIKVIVQVYSGIPSEYQTFLAIYDIPGDPDQYSLWHSTQTDTNISHYKNPRIDKLLENGRVELDLEVRKKIYLDFQRFLVEDSPAIFLYHPITYRVLRK